MTDPTSRAEGAGPLPEPVEFDPQLDAAPAAISGSSATIVLLVAADDQSDWCADVAIRIASDQAATGRRAVLADLHLDDPFLHDRLQVENLEGLVDVFTYGASLARSARKLEDHGIYFISAGTYTPDADAVYQHPRWANLVSGFRETDATLFLFAPSEYPQLASVAGFADQIILLGEPRSTSPVIGYLDSSSVPGVLLVPVDDPGDTESPAGSTVNGASFTQRPDSAEPIDAAVEEAAESRDASAREGGIQADERDDAEANYIQDEDTEDADPSVGSWLQDRVVTDSPVGTPSDGAVLTETPPGDEPDELLDGTDPDNPSFPSPDLEQPVSNDGYEDVYETDVDQDRSAREPAMDAMGDGDSDQGRDAGFSIPPMDSPAPRPVSGAWVVVGLLLLVAVLAASGYLITTYRPGFLQWLDDGETDAANSLVEASAAPAAPPVATGDSLPYSVQIKSFASLEPALDQIARDRSELPAGPLFVVPEESAGVLYYKIRSGVFADTVAASAMLAALVDAGLVDRAEASGSWSLIRYTPLSFDLGEFETRAEAEIHADSLITLGVPSYSVAVPYSDGSTRWVLYGGAFSDADDAAPMREVLMDAGLTPELVRRAGQATVVEGR